MGAMTFAKQPLDDDALIRLPRVRSRDMLEFIRRGLVSVIDSSPIISPLRTSSSICLSRDALVNFQLSRIGTFMNISLLCCA